jgi:hypothetical protein
MILGAVMVDDGWMLMRKRERRERSGFCDMDGAVLEEMKK